MQVVIDIPEEYYNYIQENDNANSNVTVALYIAVACGTPLPKNHGRLIDADALLADVCFDYPSTKEDAYSAEQIRSAKTLVEPEDKK